MRTPTYLLSLGCYGNLFPELTEALVLRGIVGPVVRLVAHAGPIRLGDFPTPTRWGMDSSPEGADNASPVSGPREKIGTQAVVCFISNTNGRTYDV